MNKGEVKEMIDAAIDQHNKNATLISMAIGFSLLGFYADGLLRVVEKVTTSQSLKSPKIGKTFKL